MPERWATTISCAPSLEPVEGGRGAEGGIGRRAGEGDGPGERAVDRHVGRAAGARGGVEVGDRGAFEDQPRGGVRPAAAVLAADAAVVAAARGAGPLLAVPAALVLDRRVVVLDAQRRGAQRRPARLADDDAVHAPGGAAVGLAGGVAGVHARRPEALGESRRLGRRHLDVEEVEHAGAAAGAAVAAVDRLRRVVGDGEDEERVGVERVGRDDLVEVPRPLRVAAVADDGAGEVDDDAAGVAGVDRREVDLLHAGRRDHQRRAPGEAVVARDREVGQAVVLVPPGHVEVVAGVDRGRRLVLGAGERDVGGWRSTGRQLMAPSSEIDDPLAGRSARRAGRPARRCRCGGGQ